LIDISGLRDQIMDILRGCGRQLRYHGGATKKLRWTGQFLSNVAAKTHTLIKKTAEYADMTVTESCP
jgi:hypothetical protein